MKVLGAVREGLKLSLKSKSLWLFGLFLGIGSTGSGGGAQVEQASPGAGTGGNPDVLLLTLAVVIAVIGFLVMHLLSEGAVIEGIRRATRAQTLTVGEGFREGRAHIVPVMLIKLAYFAASAAGVIALAVPCLLVVELTDLDELGAILGILAVIAAAPLLVTLYIWHAFALRIAVLENRHTGDSIRKARLFLHGRLLLGLRLMVATLIGTLLVAIVGILLVAPVGLLVVALAETYGSLPFVLAIPLLVPVALAIVGVIGTFQSSVWTIGYLAQAKT